MIASIRVARFAFASLLVVATLAAIAHPADAKRQRNKPGSARVSVVVQTVARPGHSLACTDSLVTLVGPSLKTGGTVRGKDSGGPCVFDFGAMKSGVYQIEGNIAESDGTRRTITKSGNFRANTGSITI